MKRIAKSRRGKWTREEDEYLATYYPFTEASVLARELNRSVMAVTSRAYLRKIGKTPEFRSEVSSRIAKAYWGGGETFFCKLCKCEQRASQRHAITVNGERVTTQHCTDCATSRQLNRLINAWPIPYRAPLLGGVVA